MGPEHGRCEMILLSIRAVDSEASRANILEGLTASQVALRDLVEQDEQDHGGAVKEMNARAGG